MQKKAVVTEIGLPGQNNVTFMVRYFIFTSIVLIIGLLLWKCSGNVVSADHMLKYPAPGDVDPSEATGVIWEERPGNPVISPPGCPAWNCLAHTDPWVVDGPGGHLTAWFSSGGILANGDGFESVGPVVGRADVDEQMNFSLAPGDGPVLNVEQGHWDIYRETVSVTWVDQEQNWIMWYLGYAISFFDDPAFGQMRSSDQQGVVWERADGPVYRPSKDSWDFAFITSPRFVEMPDGEWRLYYTGAGTTVGIGLLVSHNRGETWQPHAGNPVFERDLNGWDQGILGGTVLYHNGRYMMWYSGYREPLDLDKTPIYIGLALSDDGVNWERSPYNPVLGPAAAGTWNDLRVVSPHVISQPDGSFVMFAHGQSMADITTSLGQIGVWFSPVIR